MRYGTSEQHQKLANLMQRGLQKGCRASVPVIELALFGLRCDIESTALDYELALERIFQNRRRGKKVISARVAAAAQMLHLPYPLLLEAQQAGEQFPAQRIMEDLMSA